MIFSPCPWAPLNGFGVFWVRAAPSLALCGPAKHPEHWPLSCAGLMSPRSKPCGWQRNEDEARALATDVLLAALGGLAKLTQAIPEPPQAQGRPVVVVPMLQAAKIALFQAIPGDARARAEQRHWLNNVTLARNLGKQENEVRRTRDLEHETKIGRWKTPSGFSANRVQARCGWRRDAARCAVAASITGA